MGARLTRRAAPVAVLAAVCAGAALAAPSVQPVTVKASSNGALDTPILVSSKGLALYHLVQETKGRIKCTGSCSELWPPLVVPAGAKPVAGPGLTASKLGTIRRPDGRMQVTYNGLALYRDIYDKSGQLNGQGQDGIWFAVTPAGKVTKARASTPAPAASQAAPHVPTGGQSSGAGGPIDINPPPTDCVDSSC